MAGMRPEDLYDLEWVSDPRLSPDRSTIAFTVSGIDREENEYTSDIWLAAADRSSPPRRFTSGSKRSFEPRWSPDGSRLAFVSTRDKDEAQLYVIAVRGGEAQRLTDIDEAVTAIAWSPDGASIVFCSRIRDQAYEEEDEKRRAPRRIRKLWYKLDNVGFTADRRQHLFVVPSDGSAPARQITFGDFEDSAPSWSPDGAAIAFSSSREDDWDIRLSSDIYLVSPDGGEPKKLTDSDGWHEAPSWSPDGSRVACRWFPGGFDYPRNTQIAVVEAGSGERSLLTESLDRNCSPFPEVREPVWDGDDIVFGVEDSGNTVLYRVAGFDGGKPEALLYGDVWVTGFDVVDGLLVHSQTTPAQPSDLYLGEHAVTDFGARFARARELVQPERFTATSADGSEVEAWVIRPVGFEEGPSYPVLVNVHGGPFTQYGNKFFDEFQVYASAGYAVVYSNPRGSSGYSEEWGRAIRGPVAEGPGMGTVDYEDVVAVTDEALRRFDFCDADRVGIMGGSYGGYMTSWIVGHTDRFAAACSERAVNDWYSFFGSSDEGWFFRTYIGAWPFDHPEAYLRVSPGAYVENINTPLLIVHSENDLRCDIEQAERLFVSLRLLQKEVEFVRFPAESHELSRSGSPVHRVMRFDVILEWFDRHLKATTG